MVSDVEAAGYDTHAHSEGILKSLKFTRSMKCQQARTGVPLLEASALLVFISKINHKPLQQIRKSYITTSRLRTLLATESKTFLHILKIIISFNHSILEKSN